MDAISEREPAAVCLPSPGPQGSFHLLKEVWWLVRTTGKWWLVPVLLALLLLGALVVLSGTAYAPFIYTLF
jgi:hypothetical protein